MLDLKNPMASPQKRLSDEHSGRQFTQEMTSPQPYRRQIVGLPLQRSLFHRAAKAATTIDLPGLTSESDFPARLDDNGDLFLDRSQVGALSEAFLSWFTPETLEVMHTAHATACAALVDASENAARITASLGEAAARKSSEDLANRTALVMTYGILSKFVPDVLLRALADAGDVEPPPFPEKSAGSELMRNMFTLYEACCALDYAPRRLQHEWPHVSPEAFRLVSEFCNRKRGFGPLAWDSPGYEDPYYVVRLLHSAFHEVDAEEVRQRFSSARRPVVIRSVAIPKKIAALRRVLALWLDFLERETWYVRRAFYVGMIPLLQQLTASYHQTSPGLQVSDLLFLDIDELVGGIPDPGAIHARRRHYMLNTEYLSLHGIDAHRFATMLESR